MHFIGAQKPWYYTYNLDKGTVTGNVTNYEVGHLNKWWSIFIEFVLPKLSDYQRGRMGTQLVSTHIEQQHQHQQPAKNVWHEPSIPSGQTEPQYTTGSISSGGVIVGSNQHQTLWEEGKIEYTGRDSFSNIQAHLDSQLKK